VSVRALCVDPARVHEVWPHVEHWLRKALERGGVNGDFAELENGVLHGNDLLWIGLDGSRVISAGVTSLCNGVCELLAYGGARHDELLETIEQFARAEGCTKVRVRGRKGWLRVLKDYRQPYIVLERSL